MAYTTGTMNLLLGSPLESNWGMWSYITTDSEATVKGAGYVSDAANKGMKVGDWVMVTNQATPAGYLLMCSAISAGAGTLAADIVVT